MKVVRFKTLKVRDFLSIGHKPVMVDFQNGINAIVGTNQDKEDSKNGAGKSSILCALNFAIYGNPIREVSKDHISNSVTKKGAVVELLFEVQTEQGSNEYRIVRSLKPSKCTIYKDGSDETLSTIAKCNEFLSALIRTPESVFQNSVILSLNHSTPFLALSKIDKRKYVESVMSLNAFASMAQLVKEEYSQTKREYELRAKECNTLTESLEFNEAQYREYKTKISKQEERLQEVLEEINSIVIPEAANPSAAEKLEEKISKLQKVRSGLGAHLSEKDKERGYKTRELKQLEREIEELTHSTSCPTCKREYDEVSVTAIQAEITKKQDSIPQIQDSIQVFEEEMSVLTAQIKELSDALEELENDKIELDKKEAQRQRAVAEKLNLEKLYKELQSNSQEWNFDQLKEEIETQKQKCKLLQGGVDSLNKEMVLLDAIKFIISEDGVKAFIIKKVLKLLNARILYYLQKLQANCVCSFNELFEDTIIDEQGEDKSYFNFSGGERKRIDFACMFAFADIRRLQGDVVFETVFYDELLDTSLDDKGIELVLGVVQERLEQYCESCYIVTHRTAEISTRADHVVKLEKKNGCTQICD